ncbi:LysR family transcriptional regulator [Sneathiella litorea]|nr:LysR family transcriptional regulator [Sneathiella litorea]
MTFDQIQSFYMVATLGTYRQAAERLNATQPTISARIVALENYLRTSLFNRSGHRVVLTPQGRLFLSYAEKFLELQASVLKMTRGQDELTGIIRIGASDTMAISWLPGFFSILRKRYPNAVFELHVGPSYRLREDLISREIDLAFMIGPIAHADIASLPLCVCPMVIVAAPELGLHGRLLTKDDLGEIDFFTFERLTRPYQELSPYLKVNANSSIRLNPVNSLQTIVMLVEMGLGAGAVPQVVIEQQLKNGSLIKLDTGFELPELKFSVSYPMSPDMGVAEMVRDLSMSYLKDMPKQDSIKIIY